LTISPLYNINKNVQGLYRAKNLILLKVSFFVLNDKPCVDRVYHNWLQRNVAKD